MVEFVVKKKFQKNLETTGFIEIGLQLLGSDLRLHLKIGVTLAFGRFPFVWMHPSKFFVFNYIHAYTLFLLEIYRVAIELMY